MSLELQSRRGCALLSTQGSYYSNTENNESVTQYHTVKPPPLIKETRAQRQRTCIMHKILHHDPLLSFLFSVSWLKGPSWFRPTWLLFEFGCTWVRLRVPVECPLPLASWGTMPSASCRRFASSITVFRIELLLWVWCFSSTCCLIART